MKKLTNIIIISTIALTSLLSCQEKVPADVNTDIESSTADIIDTSHADLTSAPTIHGVQYCRTDGSSPAFEYPYLVAIRSRGELDRYYNIFSGIYHLERATAVYSDTTIGWLDASDRYDEIFFEDHDLYMAVIEEGSGSIRHEVEGISDGTVTVKSIRPECQTCDMAEWHIFIEIDKGVKLSCINTSPLVYTVDDAEDMVHRYVLGRVEAYIKNVLEIPGAVIAGVTRTDFASVEDSINNVYGKSLLGDTPVFMLYVQMPDTNTAVTFYADDRGYVFAAEGIALPEHPSAPSNY